VGRHLFPRVLEDGDCEDEREGLNTVAVAMTNAKAYETGFERFGKLWTFKVGGALFLCLQLGIAQSSP